MRRSVLEGSGVNSKNYGVLQVKDPKSPGGSTVIIRTFTDGDVGESRLLPHALLRQSGRFMFAAE